MQTPYMNNVKQYLQYVYCSIAEATAAEKKKTHAYSVYLYVYRRQTGRIAFYKTKSARGCFFPSHTLFYLKWIAIRSKRCQRFSYCEFELRHLKFEHWQRYAAEATTKTVFYSISH